MDREKKDFSNAGYILFKINIAFYVILAIHLIGVSIPLLNYYNYPNINGASQFQNETFQEQAYFVLGVAAVMITGVLFLFKWYEKKLQGIREEENKVVKYKAYYTYNVGLIVGFAILASIPIVFYFMTALHFFGGLYMMLVFIILPLERPTITRFNRNLRLKGDDAKQARAEYSNGTN